MGGGGLGYGQTWQNVTASRWLGGVFSNNTGKPIFASVSVFGQVGTTPYAYVNGVPIAECTGGTGSVTDLVQGACSFVVPNLSTYEVVNTAGPAATLIVWSELR